MSKYLDKVGLEHYHDLIKDGLYEYIEGTQSSATSTWTGVSTQPSLSSGKLIIYHLPYAGGSAVPTLNLTLPDNTTTGAKTVGSKAGTFYSAGDCIPLVYNGTSWGVVDGFDITGAITSVVKSNLTANRALVSDANGKIAVSNTTANDLVNVQKNNLLSDATAVKFGLDNTGTPDDAFNASYEETKFAIGDTIEGKSLQDDGWVVCDGSEFSDEDYPEFGKLIPYTGSVVNETLPAGSTTINKYGDWVKEINGYYVTFRSHLLCYKPTTGGEWQTVDWLSAIRSSYSSATSFAPLGIEYDDNRNLYLVVAIVHSGSSSSYAYKLFYMENLSDQPTVGNAITSARDGSSSVTSFGSPSMSGNGRFEKVCGYFVITGYRALFSTDPVAHSNNSSGCTWYLYNQANISSFFGDYVAIGALEFWDNRIVVDSFYQDGSDYYYALYVSEKNPSFTNPNFTIVTFDIKSTSSVCFFSLAYLESQKIVFCTRSSYNVSYAVDISDVPTYVGSCEAVTSSTTGSSSQYYYEHQGSKTIDGFMYNHKFALKDDPDVSWSEASEGKTETTIMARPHGVPNINMIQVGSSLRKGIKFFPLLNASNSQMLKKIKVKTRERVDD